MGYSTEFEGHFTVAPPLKPVHAAFLKKFSVTRRVKRNERITAGLPDPERVAVGLPPGTEGAFYVGNEGGDYRGTAEWRAALPSLGVVDYNQPPAGQPGLWCQWVPTPDGAGIEWNEGEKFYDYDQWLQYLIDQFLQPWGYTVSGSISWSGEEEEDVGILEVTGNVVRSRFGES